MEFIYNHFLSVKGNTMFFAFFFVFYMYILVKNDKREQFIFFPYLAVLFISVFNVIFAEKIAIFFNVTDVYYRFFWCIPLVITVAYFFTDLFYRANGNRQKVVYIFFLAVSIILSGSTVLNRGHLVTNPFKVPEPLISITEFIKKDSGIENPIVAFDYELNMYARQYDASLYLSLNRDFVVDLYNLAEVGITDEIRGTNEYNHQRALIFTIMQGNPVFPEFIEDAIVYTGTQYLVFQRNQPVNDAVEAAHCALVAEVDEYCVYRYYGDSPDILPANEAPVEINEVIEQDITPEVDEVLY